MGMEGKPFYISSQRGSIELIALGLLCALIVIVSVQFLTSVGQNTHDNLTVVDSALAGSDTVDMGGGGGGPS